MREKKWRDISLSVSILGMLLLASCSPQSEQPESSLSSPIMSTAENVVPDPSLGINPRGKTELEIDMSRIHNPELLAVFEHIDGNIDEHVENLQRWIRQPSVSNTGEGIQESAYMVEGFFDQLGCQETEVVDPGLTEYGTQANPLVYAKCDEGAEKTMAVYWMYDTMPITQPDLWTSPPFEARIVEQPPFDKVIIGRGANNSKGRQMAFWNAMMSIKAEAGSLPVNLIFIAEGDEERMSIGYRKFIRDNPGLFSEADIMWGGGSSEGSIFVELITSGEAWGRGPTYSNIHGGRKRQVDAPAWRHIKMLATLVDDSGNEVLIDGFYDDVVPLTEDEEAILREAAEDYDVTVAAERLGVARFISDDPYEVQKLSRYGQSMNLDGIWAGNMFEGGSGAILPNRIVSKHNFRYVPNQTGPDIVAKLRTHLDKHGYEDVEINVVGDVPWAKMDDNNELAMAVREMRETFGAGNPEPILEETILGGYWPAYLFAGDVYDIPIADGYVGGGGGSHAANEYFIVEGAGNTYGMAGMEKSIATAVYEYAGINKAEE
ncbi:M20/M25/M40 family metallo-hydrolase [Gammaproteobacteria bacterium]|nr:M20/M25/M40 family metallo-hydrolase [Gammaproteobacteria bacterium]